MIYRFFLVIFVTINIFFINNTFAQTAHKHLRTGNKNYDDGNFTAAEESYRKAAEQGDKTVKSPYNLGNAIYQQKRYDEALKHYESALNLAQSPPQKAKIHYNMGNTYMAQKDYQKGVDAYKKALRLLPNDPSVQHNLSVALRMKRQQQQSEKNSKESDKKNDKKDDKKDDKNGATGQSEQRATKNNQPAANNEQSQEGKEKKQPVTAQQPAQDLKHEQARELLRIMDNEERKVQEKVHRAKGAAVKNGKDW